MADNAVRDTVRSMSSGIVGRTLNSARTNHFVLDSPSGPGEAVGNGEAFLSGISSCGPRGGVTTVFLPIEAASFSICFGVGIRQLAGRSLMAYLEHIKNKCRVRRMEQGRIFLIAIGYVRIDSLKIGRAVGTSPFRSS